MTVHIPSCDETRKVKEIQSWKKSVQSVNVGERAALLVTNLEPDRCNRTVICEPGALTKIHQFMGTVKRIKQFHHQMRTRSKVHLSVGFEVVMAECQFLLPAADGSTTSEEYEWSDEMTEGKNHKCELFIFRGFSETFSTTGLTRKRFSDQRCPPETQPARAFSSRGIVPGYEVGRTRIDRLPHRFLRSRGAKRGT